MWTIGRSKRAKLISEGQNEVAKVQCVSSKEEENSENLEKYLGERIFKRISELQGQLKEGHKEKVEHLDKIAGLEAKILVEAEEKEEYLKTIAEVQGKFKEAHHETAEHLKNIWKLEAKFLFVAKEKVEHLKKISELEEELKESVKSTRKAVQVCTDGLFEERRICPAAGQRSAERVILPGTSSDTSDRYTSRSLSPNSAGPKSQKRRRSSDTSTYSSRSILSPSAGPRSQKRQIPHTFTYRHDSDDSKSSGDDSISSRSKSSVSPNRQSAMLY